ncbi:ATPase AAA [Clostridia bacterium]|nr:ATPase AAA [Clostridia bacterium]
MIYRESETAELKQQLTDDIKLEVMAFANSDGGTVYVGVHDNGEVLGLENAQEDLLSVNNSLRDSIKPDITLFAHSHIETVDGKEIIVIDVQRGSNRPYYIAGKGIRPEGVYVRHGAASVPATDTAIRKMIRETDGDSYEKLRSVEQSLDFTSSSAEFAKRNVPFGAAQMGTLGIVSVDGVFTNLGLLLSEQCVHTIKTAVFQDTTQQVFSDRHEFSGSLFSQINDVYDYLDMHNQTQATFDKLLRIDRRDYPETALREALLNAVVHREYATSGSVFVKIYSDRIEFISPGGLMNGIEIGDIMSGYSVCRNANLAAVFYRLQLIEAYGTGILKIFEAYKAAPKQPKIDITPNVFKLTLPNLNAVAASVEPTPQDSVLRYVREHGSISRKQAEDLLGVSQTAAGVVLKKMIDNGELSKSGRTRQIRYFAIEK